MTNEEFQQLVLEKFVSLEQGQAGLNERMGNLEQGQTDLKEKVVQLAAEGQSDIMAMLHLLNNKLEIQTRNLLCLMSGYSIRKPNCAC